MNQSLCSFFGSSKSSDKANDLKRSGNTHYKNKCYHNAVRAYTQAMFYCPWPLPQVMRHIDDCTNGLDPELRNIFNEDISRVREVTEPANAHTSLLAQCYGNRSAALYELGQHEGVVADIDRALCTGYEKPQVFKLYKRKAFSLARVGKLKEARKVAKEFSREIESEDSGLTAGEKEKYEKDVGIINTEIKLSERINITPSEDNPVQDTLEHYVSDLIKVENAPEIGRHIKSVEEIPKGTCIVQESPYVSILNTEYMYTHCTRCFKECLTLIPCMLCVNTGYCCHQCMYESWQYHWIECKNAKEWNRLPWIAQMALRMVLLTPKLFLQSLVKEGSIHSIDVAIEKAKNGLLVTPAPVVDKELSVLSLVAHTGKYSNEEQRNLIEKEALRTVDSFKRDIIRYFDLKECHATVLYDLIRFHMCQLRCNTSTISVNTLTTLEEGTEDSHNVRDMVKQRLGYSLFRTASLFNHSCDPNVFFRFEGNCVKVIVPNGAPGGIELSHCYGPQIGKDKKITRQKTLKDGFMFTCTCKACFNPDKDMLFKEYAWDGLRCPKCEGVLPVVIDDYKTSCLKCGKEFPLCDLLKQRDEARRMYTEAMEDKSLMKLLECEKLQKSVLFSSNLELAKTRDTIAYFCVMEDNIERAVDFILASYNAITSIFGTDSIESAEEMSKVTQILFRSDRISEALRIVTKAIPLIQLYYGPKHMDILQLQNMIDICGTS